MTLDEFNERLAAQNFKCAICSVEASPTKVFHVDHDHETGAVRGLLCHRCNVAIALLHEKLSNFDAAAAYLRRHGKK